MSAFKWTIEIEVAPSWVADGFDPDADQFKDAILAHMLGLANPDEVTVRVIGAPDPAAVQKEQGCPAETGFRKVP